MVLSRNLDVGSVFAAKFCPDSTMQLAVGGSQGEYRIWDMSTNAGVRATFGDASVQASSVVEKPLVGVQNDDDEGDDDDDDNNEEAVLREMHADIKSDDDDEDDDDDDEEMASDDE
ncbi:rRNA-processing protein [Linderina macrospora]|uniref:rRNA-processing protein n=1 Tax=Linderina macrospora TaxID=4868 RepID=A0ACC1IZA1_9FUNG|nr:rRNA-processing protein [Linderina macrospora]